MNITDILSLAKAGFTAEQIGKLVSVEAGAKPVDLKQDPGQANRQDPSPGPVTKQDPEPKPDPANDLNALAAQMKELTAQMKLNALNQAIQPKPQTTEDIIANIINPPVKEDK